MGLKAINLRGVSEELHKRLKLQAVSEGVTMQDLILKAVEEYLKKVKKGGGKDGSP